MKAEDRKAILALPDDDGYMLDRTAVVVVSCSRFHQVWRPFFTLFRRYWPDCPYPVYFLTDTEKHGIPDAEWLYKDVGDSGSPVIVYTTPKDRGWCDNFCRLSPVLQGMRILLFQEDFLLKAPVDTPVVQRLVRYAHDVGAGCLRLMPCPGPDRPWRDPFLGVIGPEADYRVSLQVAIWDLELFRSLAMAAASPWVMEREGAKLTRDIPSSFLSVHRTSPEEAGSPIPYFATAVRNRRWLKGALDLLRREGISMDGITEIIP